MFARHVAAALVVLVYAALAQGESFVRRPGPVRCSKLECVYTPVNKAASELVYDMVRVVFSDVPPMDGYVRESRDGGQVMFAHPDSSTLESLKQVATEYDTLSNFNSPPRVAVSVEVYLVDSDFLDSLMAQIGYGNRVVEATAQDRVSGVVAPDGGMFSLTGALGNLPTSFIKMQLQMGKNRGVRKMKEQASFIVPNGRMISYTQAETRYKESAGSINTISESLGLSLMGTVQINARNFDLVRIKDFNIKYSIPTNHAQSLMKSIAFSSAEVDIKKGYPYIVTSNELTVDHEQRKNAFIFGGGRQQAHSNQRLLIMVSVTPIPAVGD